MERPTSRILLGLSLISILFIGACSEPPAQDLTEIFPEPTASQASCSGQKIEGQFIVRWRNGRLSVEKGQNREQFIRDFIAPRAHQISHVEHDQSFKVNIGEFIDSRSTQPALNWGPDMVGASAAWARNIKGQDTIVAVIDTGVDINHRDLKNQIYINKLEFNGKPDVDDDNNGYIDDVTGWNFVNSAPLTKDNQYHGTHVAGIIAASSATSKTSGIAPLTKILPLAFLNGQGEGTTSGALLAFRYAIENGANVINASWGGGTCSTELEGLIAESTQKSIFFVAASGNEGLDLNIEPDYPASYGSVGYEGMLVVGASTPADLLAGFSNFGTAAVHLVAPGDGIYSTYPNNQIVALSGTSMATPFVSGAVAVLLSHPNKPSMAQVRKAILESVKTGRFKVQSSGRLDIRAALPYLD